MLWEKLWKLTLEVLHSLQWALWVKMLSSKKKQWQDEWQLEQIHNLAMSLRSPSSKLEERVCSTSVSPNSAASFLLSGRFLRCTVSNFFMLVVISGGRSQLHRNLAGKKRRLVIDSRMVTVLMLIKCTIQFRNFILRIYGWLWPCPSQHLVEQS